MSKIIPMMFCFDKNYAIPAAVAFYSLLENNKKEALGGGVEFRLYVVHNDIPLEHQNKLHETIKPFNHFAKLEFIDDNGRFNEVWHSIEAKNHFSQEMFYKLAAPSLFPQYEKIIISDVDVVFLGNVIYEFENFNTDQEYLIGGVVSNNPESFFPIPKQGYLSGYIKFSQDELKSIQYGIAGGYLIINLKQWRLNSIEEKAIKFLEQKSKILILPEQDVLSIICYPHIKNIHPAHIVGHTSWIKWGNNFKKLTPNIYTQQEINEMHNSPIQLHYIGGAKPWNTPSEPKSEIWFSYLAKTPFLGDLLNKVEDLILQKHYRASWKYQFHKMLKNPKILLQPSTYKKVLDKLF